MGSGVLWKITVTEHSLLLHHEMQLEIVFCKEEGIYSFCAETPLSSLGWTERQCKCVLWSDKSTFQLFWGKMDVGIYVPKMKKTIQTVTNEKCKNQPL